MSNESFAVVVPMFNEEAGARNCIDQITRVLRECSPGARLIAVNDGSSDHTPEILHSAAESNDVLTIVAHEKNSGYGQALQSGARRALQLGYGFVIFMDSDLTNHPRWIPRFVEQMRPGIDLIKASRYMPGGGVDGVPHWRYWISRLGNAVASSLFGLPISDCTNGFRAIRTDLFAKMTFREKGFAMIMEELYQAKLMGCRVLEIPNTLTSRTAAQRPTSFSYTPSTFWGYLKYALMARLGMK
jgi:glycosyltransferase involved in cell wall biosynthesis